MIFTVSSILITSFIYFTSKKLYARKKRLIFSPLLVTPVALICLLVLFHIPYGNYNSGGQLLTYMLQPATVAFAIPLYKYYPLLRRHAVEIFLSVFAGSIVAILSSVLFSVWLKLSPKVVDSIAPRSITTPFAMALSKTLGGIPPITATFVIITGLVGVIIGPLILALLPIKTKIAKGVLFGMGAHGAGTSKAFEIGSVEGTTASLAMIIAAGMTVFIAPVLVPAISVYVH